jgi:hypothetical protein
MKTLWSKITGTKTSFFANFGDKLSFIHSFLFPERLHCCYIYASTCTTTMITLEPCALDAEFQQFILRFNKFSLLWGYHSNRGDRGLQITLNPIPPPPHPPFFWFSILKMFSVLGLITYLDWYPVHLGRV